jgi:hypothetical protein
VFHVAHVHVAVAPARESAAAAHVLRQNAAGRDAAHQEDGQVAMRRQHHVLGPGKQRRTYRNGLLPAPHVHPADDFPLPVELAFDAVFQLAHRQHVMQTLVRQSGFRGALVGLIPSNGLDGTHWG